MENSSSSSKKPFHLVAASLVFLQMGTPTAWAESSVSNSYQVLSSVVVPEGHWNELPDLYLKLRNDKQSAPVQFQLIAAAAEQAFMQNLLDDARKSFQKLLKAKKPSPSQFLQEISELRLAEIDLLDNRADEALKRLEPLSHHSNPYLSDEAVFLQARCFLQKHEWGELSRVVTKLAQQNPAYADDLALNLIQGVALLEQGKLDAAMVFFQHFPDEPSAIYYLTVCYVQKKDMSNALPLYQKILQRDSRSEWVDRMRLVLGEAFYASHDISSAHEFFKPITRPGADPDVRTMALHRQACLFFQEKKYDESEKILVNLLKQSPNHPLRTEWTYLYASIPIFKRDWKKSISEQKAALEDERGLAPRLHGVDVNQLKITAQFRILWAHLLLNDFSGTRRLADNFIAKYPKEQIASYAYLAKGIAYYRGAEYDKALDVYQDLLNKYPESSACGKAVYLMTLCLHSARDPFRAAGILNSVHARLQTTNAKSIDEWTENTLYWIADAYYQLNDFTSAEKLYREFLTRAPQSTLVPYALEGLGAVLSAQGPQRDQEAIVALQQAELRARDLNNKEFAEQVEVELAKVYYNQRNFAKAGAIWAHLSATSSQSSVKSESMFREADALTRQDFYQEAIKRWKTLVQLFKNEKNNPWVSEALMRSGNTQAGLGQWTEATQTFTVLKQAYPNSVPGKEASFQLVQCAFNLGNVPQAVTELIGFAKDYPDDPRIPKAADNLLNAMHQRKVSVPPTQQAMLLKMAPGSSGGAALLWEKGAALFNEGKYEAAQKLFEKIMLSYPNDEYVPTAYFYNADSFFWMKKWDEGANAYQNFYLSFPKHERVPNAMFQKAVCLFRKGDYNAAVDDFRAFLDKYPNHALAKEAWLNIALAHKKAFQLDQAVTAYQFVIDKYPKDSKLNAVWLQMGSLLDVQGKRMDAVKAYARVPSNAPEYPEAMYRISLLYEQEQNLGEAKSYLEAVRGWPEVKNEYRMAALIRLSEIYEQEGAPAAKLKPLYIEIRAATNDPEIAKQAALRIQELSK